MKNILLFIFFLVLLSSSIHAQPVVLKPTYLKTEINDSIKTNILNSLDSLFDGINKEKLNSKLIDNENFEFNESYLKSFKGAENKDSIKNFYKIQLLNIYPVSASEYMISIAYLSKNNQESIIGSINNILAKKYNNSISFSNPIKYYTRKWKNKIVGNITYFYRDTLNLKRATEFNDKNHTIAIKLGLKPKKFNFYMCLNYQEVLHLIGTEYDVQENGISNSGYIFDPNTLFSIMNNEDFSHDVFHIYASEVRKQKRNSTAEEGIAYSWGNAYYADDNENIPSQKELVFALKKYLKENPQTDLLNLFDKRPKIFNYTSKISVKSVLSGIICDEVEKKKGVEGIKQLIDCGSGDENYFKCIDKLIQINRDNFNQKVKALIEI